MGQKLACQQIIESKDRRIREFQTELKTKDEDYVKMLKQQGADITSLILKMRDQYHTLRKSYEQQLEDIEASFTTERKEMLERNKAEIDALFDKRREMKRQSFLRSARSEKNSSSSKSRSLELTMLTITTNARSL